MNVSVTWLGEACFEGKSSGGHSVIMDGPPDHGGKDRGPRPMEMLLLGIGGCASFDVVHFLKKARQIVESCQVEVKAKRAEGVPSVFEEVHLHFIVSGAGLKEDVVARMVELSAEKYCSASIMMARAGAKVGHSFEIRPA